MLPQMDLNSWLTYLETLHPKAIDLGLERVSQVAKTLGLLTINCPVITVSGTNGKGSCVALLEAILSSAGYKVGAYSSPHLIKYNERIRLNKIEATDIAICEAFDQIEQARGKITLTYFEMGTLAALLLFKQANLDAIILEVGMGGRLDAVNIVDPDIAIISTIALDHMEILGADREAIGREKAGIMRSDKPVICGDFDPPVTVFEAAQNIGARLFCQGKEFAYQAYEDSWSWWNNDHHFEHLPLPKIAVQNAATVLEALQFLPAELVIDRAAIDAGLNTVFMPARFQIFDEPIQRIFDVAHNPAAAQLLALQLQKLPKAGRTLAVIGMLKDKDLPGTLQPLLHEVTAWYVAGLSGPRGGTAESLAECLHAARAAIIYEYEDVTTAYKTARVHAQPGDRILVFGSFHTVAEAMQVEI